MTLVIAGDGKGKTISDLGMALRAWGAGLRVCIIQFIKGTTYAGEWGGIKKMGSRVELIATGMGFCLPNASRASQAEHRKRSQAAIQLVHEKMASGHFDLLDS
ncbi:ATP:corrinoid adenosyltransferase BtuR/CobO/CobP [Geothermobacter ehrlichii]|uniref:corrinoid adenosyltransferase n=1 Tax=Geothermobacter ehrlichii TaxID=213224 RepID=A0A5D3WG74_9BACT|nr:cob(I)yrinic acid a,c-diamide adenosyltransferase [Geothermobacter ehrlichii]TYO95030.1 ATP:corrinoid adenosyltransferase BtuR/CobO/CobP [Geothermobacter ehrlichii]